MPTPDEHDDVPGAPGAPAVCDECKDLDAELVAHYPGIRDRPPQWCAHCAGPELAALVAAGLVVTVTSTDLRMVDDPRPAVAVRAAAVRARPAGLTDDEPGVTDLEWTVEMATEVVRYALPPGRVFLRALVDEGGTATAERLKEVTGAAKLNNMTLTVNSAVRTVMGRLRHRDRHLARPLHDPDNPRRATVTGYELPAALVPILDQALTQTGYPPGRSRADSD